jgi:hypothetical protein
MQRVVIMQVVNERKQDNRDELVNLISDLIGVGQEDLVAKFILNAARRPDPRLSRLERIERMLERMIELQLMADDCSTDMMFDCTIQYYAIRKQLIRAGILEKDVQYDLDDLGLLYARLDAR